MYEEIDIEQIELILGNIFKGSTIIIPPFPNNNDNVIRVINRDDGQVYFLSIKGINTLWYLTKGDLILSTNSKDLMDSLIDQSFQLNELDINDSNSNYDFNSNSSISSRDEEMDETGLIKNQVIQILGTAPSVIKGNIIEDLIVEDCVFIPNEIIEQAVFNIGANPILLDLFNRLIIGIDEQFSTLNIFRIIFKLPNNIELKVEIGTFDLIFYILHLGNGCIASLEHFNSLYESNKHLLDSYIEIYKMDLELNKPICLSIIKAGYNISSNEIDTKYYLLSD